MIGAALKYAFPGIAGFALAIMFFRPAPVVQTETRWVERTPYGVRDSIQKLEEEVGSLRSRIAGRRALDRIVHVYDTVYVEVPETVMVAVRIRPEAVETVTGVVDSVGMRAGLSVYTLPEDCDDGLTLSPTGVICDAARLGHLSLFAGLGVTWSSRDGLAVQTAPGASLGLRWRPSWRSRWTVSARLEATSVDLRGSLWATRDFVRFF